MEVKYEVVVINGKVVEEEYFVNICCEDMRKALLAQETPLADIEAGLWLYCPFCKQEIEY